MVVAVTVIGMLAVVACMSPARADANVDALAAAQTAYARHDYTTALKLLRPLADQGNALAQYGLGLMYENGRSVPKDDAEAARWFRKAAEQGLASAQNTLGLLYAEGRGVPQNYTEAARWYRKAAEQGDDHAQGALGYLYSEGKGVPRDDPEAVRWTRKSAEQANTVAQASLGVMYAEGRGVPRDLTEAAHWYRKAAEQGYAFAQGLLGVMYVDGQGVPRDYVQAYVWFNVAAAGGSNDAAQDRDRLEGVMTAAQIAEAQQRTAAWKPTRSGDQKPAAPPNIATKQEPSPGQLGTAFFIGESGLLLTNAHVVTGCSEVTIGPLKQTIGATPEQIAKARAAGYSEAEIETYLNQPLTARVIARDTENDLALLRTAAHPPAVATLRLSIRQGEAIAAYGFPLPGLLASGGNMTTGNVAALSGIGDDGRLLQISAPVQPGNSGGPLLDGSGNVVGIVEAKLNAIKIASAIGDVPQNVNFAIKAVVVATFLDSNGIHYSKGEPGAAHSPADIAEEAKRFTMPVECGE